MRAAYVHPGRWGSAGLCFICSTTIIPKYRGESRQPTQRGNPTHGGILYHEMMEIFIFEMRNRILGGPSLKIIRIQYNGIDYYKDILKCTFHKKNAFFLLRQNNRHFNKHTNKILPRRIKKTTTKNL